MLNTTSGECTIYAIRPYRCRGLTSYDVEPCETGAHAYQVDHVRFYAYSGANLGASLPHLPNERVVMEVSGNAKNVPSENLAVGVLMHLTTEEDNSAMMAAM
jgi:hypothetical protein